MALIVVVQNVSQLADVSDYTYTVLVTTRNTDTGAIGERVIATGEVKGHTRADGWAVLLEKLLDANLRAG